MVWHVSADDHGVRSDYLVDTLIIKLQFTLRVIPVGSDPDALANVGTLKISFWAPQQSPLQSKTIANMNSLSFDDPSLDNLDPTLPLNDPSDIDTALLSDIDGKH